MIGLFTYHAVMREKITILENKKSEIERKFDVSRREEYEKQTEELLEPIVAEQGFELVDVEYVKEAGNWYTESIYRQAGRDHSG